MNKVCSDCKTPKPLTSFHKDNRGTHKVRSICKSCAQDRQTDFRRRNRDEHNARAMLWYRSNPEKTREINLRNWTKVQAKREAVIAWIFNNYPCLNCGEDRRPCLDFHHIDPTVKERGIAQLRTAGLVIKEVAKCVILCSNCHRLFHAGYIELPEITSGIILPSLEEMLA